MAHKVSFHYSAFSHNLQTVSAREHRFNLVLVDRSIETSLRLHLAFDHSSINCAINWGTRNRGLLLSCLANTFVLCVFGVSANISLSSFLEFLCSKLQDSVLSQPIPIQLLEWGGEELILPTLTWSFYCVFRPMCQNMHTAVLFEFLCVSMIKSRPNMSREAKKQCLLGWADYYL